MDADLELAGDITTLKNELLPRLLGKLKYWLTQRNEEVFIDDIVRTYMSTTEPQLAKQEASKAFLFPPNPAILAGSQMSPPLYSAILFGQYLE